MRALKICLGLVGILCLLAGVGLFLPVSLWDKIVQLFGAQGFVNSAVTEYIVRLSCASFAFIGVFYIILTVNPARYGVMTPFGGLAALLLGITALVVGILVQMPVLWFLSDGLVCVILGILILFFWRAASSRFHQIIQ